MDSSHTPVTTLEHTLGATGSSCCRFQHRLLGLAARPAPAAPSTRRCACSPPVCSREPPQHPAPRTAPSVHLQALLCGTLRVNEPTTVSWGNCHFLDWPPKHEDGPGAVPGVTPGLRRGGRWQGMLPGRGLPIPTGPPRPAARPSRLGSDAWAGQRASALSAPPSPPVPRRDDSNLGRESASAPSQAVWLPMPGDRETPVSKSDASERERGALPKSAGSGEWAWLPRKVGRLVSPSAADASPASRGPRVPCGASRGPAQCLVQGRGAGDSSEPAGPHNSADNLGTVAGPLPHST